MSSTQNVGHIEKIVNIENPQCRQLMMQPCMQQHSYKTMHQNKHGGANEKTATAIDSWKYKDYFEFNSSKSENSVGSCMCKIAMFPNKSAAVRCVVEIF